MSNIWNRGSEPSGGIPVAPDEKVGPVLVPADWVLVLSVCKRQRDTFLKNQLFIQCSLHNNFQPINSLLLNHNRALVVNLRCLKIYMY